MISLLRNKFQQKALFHIIHEDDIYLLNTEDAEWFQVLYLNSAIDFRIVKIDTL